MSVLASVQEAMEESEGLLGLELTWEELKNQLVVAVDALSVSLPPTSSAQVTALYLDQMVTKIKEDAYEHSHIMERLIEETNIQISSPKNELENVKKPGAIVNVRTSTMHPVPCVSFLLQTRTASHVVIPLLNAKVVCRISTWQSCSRKQYH